MVPVPDLVGLSAREAQDVALDGELLAVVVGPTAVSRGVVSRQRPTAGWQVRPRTVVRIWVSASGAPDSPPTDDDDGGGGGGGRGGFGPKLPWRPEPRAPSGAK